MGFPTNHLSANKWKIYVESNPCPPFHTSKLVIVTLVSFGVLTLLLFASTMARNLKLELGLPYYFNCQPR